MTEQSSTSPARAAEPHATSGAPRRITNEELERVAAEEAVHPLSVLRSYAGIEVRGRAGQRAAVAVARLWGARGTEGPTP